MGRRKKKSSKKGFGPGQNGVATQFKPGVSGNPSGKPALPAEINESRKLSTQEVIRVASDFLRLTVREVREVLEDEDSHACEALVASIIVSGINGSHQHVKELLDRVIGKPKETVDLTVESKSLHMMLVEVMEKHRKADE